MLRHGSRFLPCSSRPSVGALRPRRTSSKSLSDGQVVPGTKKTGGVVVSEVAAKHGVRLTKTELMCLRNQLDMNKDGLVSVAEVQKAGKKALEQRWTRELCLSVVERPQSNVEQFGARLLSYLDYFGTALFAVVGTQLAGEKEMNLIGCTLVGCIAAMGGGTLNNMLYGSSALLLDRPGVFWVRVPSYLMVSLAASILTFYSWPVYCRQAAKQELEQFIGKQNLNSDGSVAKEVFVDACQRDRVFAESIATAFGMEAKSVSPSDLFAAADADKTGKISLTEMEAVVAKQFDASPTMYALDTAALSAFAVVAVNGAVQRGLHPLVAATSGVTICFGKRCVKAGANDMCYPT